MSNIDKRALREIAEAAVGAHERLSVMPPDDIFDISLAEGTQLDADITALNALNSAANPTTVLALLDELDKWQQESSAWQAVAEKQLALAEDAENRIAELEAREVVPDEMTPKQASRSYCGEVRGYRDGWNACRAAMLQGKSEQPQNAQQNIPENIPGGNSPVTPDGWVMVPKEPTQAMIKAWLSEIANFRGHAAGYRAAIEAAPQLEVNRG